MSKGSEIAWLSEKRHSDRKYSKSDFLFFLLAFVALLTSAIVWIAPSEISAKLSIPYNNIAMFGWATLMASILCFAAAFNKYEDLAMVVGATFILPGIIYMFGGNLNGVFDDYNSGVNNLKNALSTNVISPNNNYQMANVQAAQQVTVAQPTKQDHSEAQRWMRIGAQQKLVRGNPLSKEGLAWCETNGNAYNQARLHCKTGYKWSTSDWSNRNDTK